MLARERSVLHEGREVFRTPLLVPSFSSKGFREVRKIVEVMREFITGAVLVSAYDIGYGNLSCKLVNFPSLVFLDSGGYEGRVEHDLSEAYGEEYKPRRWTVEDHRRVLADWPGSVPTVAISYDSPHRRTSIDRQLRAALRLKREFPRFMHEFLVKPRRKDKFVEIAEVSGVVGGLKEFSVIGFTEHELDHRIMGRMEKIAGIRRILDESGVQSPVHVFGSLDTLSTVLYFLAGAEIFDGLTWLRFGFHNGQTLYRQNYGAIHEADGILKTAQSLSHGMWRDNYYYLESLRDRMSNYARTGDFSSFDHNREQVEAACRQLLSRVSA